MMSLLPVLMALLLRGATARLHLSVGPSPYVTPPGKDALLPCLFRVDDSPVDLSLLTVSWKLNDHVLVLYNESVTAFEPRARLCPDELKKGNASLALAEPTAADNGNYSCEVVYGEDSRSYDLILHVEAQPALFLQNQVVVLHEYSELLCSITGQYPSNITIQWLQNGKVLEGSTLYPTWNSTDGEPSLTSSYSFIPREKDTTAIYKCQALHKSLTSPLEVTFSLVLGVRPTVQVLDKGWSKKHFMLFLCNVTSFYPPEISVLWTVNGNPADIPTPARKWHNQDGTFSLEESYLFEPYSRHNGAIFSCIVRHATIQGTARDSIKLVISPHLPNWMWYVSAGLLLLVGLSCLRRRVGDIVSLNDWIDGGIVTLDCQMKGRVPGNIMAVWVIKRLGQEQEIRETKVNRWSEDYTELVNRNRYSCRSTLVKGGLCGVKRSFSSSLVFQVSKSEDDGAEFICRFLSADKVLAEKSRAGVVMDNKTYYSVSGLDVPKECVAGELLILSCSLKGAFPQKTEMTWEKRHGDKRMPIQRYPFGGLVPAQDPSTPTYQITENRSENLLMTFLTFVPSLQDHEVQFCCRFLDDGGRVNAERCSQHLNVVRAKERKPDFCLSSDWGFESTNGVTQEESGL
ncbi:hypothetical protein NDU88_003380 [Pleurodeles waltl]|uniref:Ig-like domain-containing protein n=1 Tax=Pleurodeles waltl TaxID=8319 RepID=A0AAV7PGR0_PLEWA|nr:hypothetical protein NDU88_003380 [Pleurodeles waltl]